MDLLWELARLHHEAGNKKDSDEAKLTDYHQCQDYAKKAIHLDDKSAPAHFWLGICYGKEARIKGMFDGLSLSDKIKIEMTRVIELDPLYGDAGGHRALGRLFTKIPKLFGGDLSRAREHLEEAVRLAPDFSTNHLYLAEVYLNLKEYDLALHHLKVVQEFPDRPGEEERILEERKKAKELMRDVPPRIRNKNRTAGLKGS